MSQATQRVQLKSGARGSWKRKLWGDLTKSGEMPLSQEYAAQASGTGRHLGCGGGWCSGLSLELVLELSPSPSLFGPQGPKQGHPFHRMGPWGPGRAFRAPGHRRSPGQSRRVRVGAREATPARPLPEPPPPQLTGTWSGPAPGLASQQLQEAQGFLSC